MNLQETLQLLDKLNALGAKHFKSNDLEVSFGYRVSLEAPKEVRPEPPPQAPGEQYSAENTQKVQELIDLLKLKDEELVNRIFPAGA